MPTYTEIAGRLAHAVALGVAAALWLPNAATAEEAGVRQITIDVPGRAKPVNGLVWYPTASSAKPVTIGASVFFEGVPAIEDSPPSGQDLPVIVLSHGAGLGGRAEALAWMAAPLAAAGYVVVSPTHPGNTGPDRSAAETLRLWRRVGDLTAALDRILADADLAPRLDPERIGALGLSMGGHSALALAGARIDAARLQAYCDTFELNPSLCGWVKASGVDLRALDMSGAEAPLADPRIRSAMAIDPALIDTFEPGSFEDVPIPVALVNLGPAADLVQTLDAAPAAAAIPGATYEVIEAASHYSMFGLCTPAAPEIAQEEQIDEPICSDGTASSRAEVHRALIDLTLEVFADALGAAK